MPVFVQPFPESNVLSAHLDVTLPKLGRIIGTGQQAAYSYIVKSVTCGVTSGRTFGAGK